MNDPGRDGAGSDEVSKERVVVSADSGSDCVATALVLFVSRAGSDEDCVLFAGFELGGDAVRDLVGEALRVIEDEPSAGSRRGGSRGRNGLPGAAIEGEPFSGFGGGRGGRSDCRTGLVGTDLVWLDPVLLMLERIGGQGDALHTGRVVEP